MYKQQQGTRSFTSQMPQFPISLPFGVEEITLLGSAFHPVLWQCIPQTVASETVS